MINAKLQSIIDTKSAIGNAIVNKGGTITGATPFFNYATEIDNISTGTPQTIFQASDGSKWALTNAVNLTNVSGNVTSDFNYWQPANNSTSDPILNGGTVNGNISGNIRIVQVNQVNIAQYGNMVATDLSNAKYQAHTNGKFNVWLLNNSATGTVVFANTIMAAGPSIPAINQLQFYANTTNLIASFYYTYGVDLDDSFVYTATGGSSANFVSRHHIGNLVTANVTSSQNSGFRALKIDNEHIYTITETQIYKYWKNNLAFIAASASSGGTKFCLGIDDQFVYTGGTDNLGSIRKYHKGNLTYIGNSSRYNITGTTQARTINTISLYGDYLYIGGSTGGYSGDYPIEKFYKGNLVSAGQTQPVYAPNSATLIHGIDVTENSIYAAYRVSGGVNIGQVERFDSNNLSFIAKSNVSNIGRFYVVKAAGDFVYATGDIPSQALKLHKFHTSNMAFVANSTQDTMNEFILNIATDGLYMYVAGGNNSRGQVSKFGLNTSNAINFNVISKIKE
jgi:hypothetical protein